MSDDKKKYHQKHRAAWELYPEFKGWLTRSNNSPYKSFCKVCYKEVQAGKTDLLTHAKSTRHKKKMEQWDGEDIPAPEKNSFQDDGIEIFGTDEHGNRTSFVASKLGSSVNNRMKYGERPAHFEADISNKVAFLLDRVEGINNQPLASKLTADELQHFGLGVAEELKAMDPNLQENARRWISEILYTAKRGTLPDPPSMFDSVQFVS